MSGSFDIVSIDLWDTVLRRACHPDETKYATARALQLSHGNRLKPGVDLAALFAERCGAEGRVGRSWQGQGFDDEYRLLEVYDDWLSQVLDGVTPAERQAIAAGLERAELAFEKTVVSLDVGIRQHLARYQGLPLVVISDFYMGAPALDALLTHVGFRSAVRSIHVSCDYRLNKRSGRLFRALHDELGIAPERQLHIGDHPTSDVEVPRRLGMHAELYAHEVEERARKRVRRLFGLRGGSSVESLAAEAIARSRGGGPGGPAQTFFELGRACAPALFSFIYSVIEQAISAGHPRVGYFTREGVFFRRIHDAIAANNPLPAAAPTSLLLEVSRLSTFGPSLRSFTTGELMRLWNQYSTQSMGALLRTLDLDVATFQPCLARHGLDIETPVQWPWDDPRVRGLFADQIFLGRAQFELRRRRTLLCSYLRERGIDDSTARLAIVDIGWRGTIQDNLAHLLPSTFIDGHYMGLYPFLNPQPENVAKHGWGCDLNRRPDGEATFAHASVVEMLCNSDTGSVLRYHRQDGRTVAEVERDPAEDGVHESAVRHFQDGVLRVVPPLARLLRGHPLEADRLREGTLPLLTALVREPPHALAQVYFRLKHNESFGLGAYVEKRPDFPMRDFLGGLVSSGNRRRFIERIEGSGWPQGLLKLYGLDPLVRQYNAGVL